MRTTFDIDAKLLEDIVRLTGEKSKNKAVNKALVEYKRQKAINELRSMAGKIQIDDLREEQRATDRKRQGLLDKLWEE